MTRTIGQPCDLVESEEDTMKRFEAPRWLDSAFVFLAMGGVFLWQLLTPEYNVLVPVRATSARRLRRSR